MAVRAIPKGKSWILAVMLLGFVAGMFALLGFTEQAFAKDRHRTLAAPAPLKDGGFQVIVSTIGDADCFGYGLPTVLPSSFKSPCGTLPPAGPIAGLSEDPQTDVLLSCPTSPPYGPLTVSFTHNFTIPPGATIVGAFWLMNVGGVESTKYPLTTVTLDVGSLMMPVPATGPLGTTLVAIPIPPAVSAGLQDGTLVATITRGVRSILGTLCDDIFVDFAQLVILVDVP